jgi:hypothetical protein
LLQLGAPLSLAFGQCSPTLIWVRVWHLCLKYLHCWSLTALAVTTSLAYHKLRCLSSLSEGVLLLSTETP